MFKAWHTDSWSKAHIRSYIGFPIDGKEKKVGSFSTYLVPSDTVYKE